MQKQLQIFENEEFGKLEVLMIKGKPYFPATECAKVLGYKNPRDAVARHCKTDGVVKRDGVSFTTNQHGISTNQAVEKTYINEGNLYRLIIRSKLPAAVRFEAWVCDEVLPSIRKHGAYVSKDVLREARRNRAYADDLFSRLQAEKNKTSALETALEDIETDLEELTETVAKKLMPKAVYCDLILQSKNLVPVSVIAKDYGMTAASFNLLLHDLRIQYKLSGTWLLYQSHMGKGYTRSRTYFINETTSVMHTCWTQRGRLFLYETLKNHGILPVVEREYLAGRESAI